MIAGTGRALPLFICALLASCSTTPTVPAQTEVCVLGMIHSGHETAELWGLEEVSATLRNLQPDAVLAEIPPDRYSAAAAQFAANGVITEPRVLRFPEYTGVLFPLQAEVGYAIVPCAAWTRPMADARRALLEDWKTTRAQDTAEVDAGEAWIDAQLAAMGDPDDPRILHTDRYDEFVRRGLEPYDRLFGDDLGPGGWTNINAAHWALLEQAIDARAGQRLVITFGSWHKYWFMDRLRERDDVVLLDARDFLPQEDGR